MNRTIRKIKLYISNNIASWVNVCISVSMMGVAISLLQLTGFGTDPYASMNYGISYLSGLSFGVCQACLNAVMLVWMVAYDWKLIGFGTVANMLLVGFVADLFSGTLDILLCGIAPALWLRIGFLVLGIAIFVVFAGIYASSGQGLSPYDGLAVVLHKETEKLFRRKVNFKIVRIPYDALYMLIGWLLGGETGFVTIGIVLFLGPVMDFIQKLKDKKKKTRSVT